MRRPPMAFAFPWTASACGRYLQVSTYASATPALFDTYVEASRAVRALEALRIDSEDISIIANKSDNYPDDRPRGVAEGAELGADLGAMAGRRCSSSTASAVRS